MKIKNFIYHHANLTLDAVALHRIAELLSDRYADPGFKQF